ncbi:hypothetical protein DERF_008087 [Dermatophagoides farinae]|uniref:Uncharacterized protein n=1 Tax=Dermatophagoides farinae TaxID=6954 RepID=A0A922I3M6_DERFA|nr:hypothetical protein DERF_008087 [Dermatophagoides farinae]
MANDIFDSAEYSSIMNRSNISKFKWNEKEEEEEMSNLINDDEKKLNRVTDHHQNLPNSN